MHRLLYLIALLLTLGRSSVPVQEPATSELAPSSLGLARLRLPSVFPSQTAVAAGPRGTTVCLTEDRTILLEGADSAGLPWRVTLGAPIGLGFDGYIADLDADHVQDLVFVGWTGACGNAPNAVLDVVAFDEGGRPILFEARSDIDGGNGKPLADIADLDGDRRCEIVLRELRSDGGDSKWDAYLVTTVYRVEHGRFRQLHRVLGRSLPILTRIDPGAQWPIQLLPPNEPPTDGRKIPLVNLSNDVPFASGKLSRVGDGRQGRAFLIERRAATMRRRLPQDGDLPGYSYGFVLVDDTATGRRVYVTSDVHQALGTIASVERRTIDLYGGYVARYPKYIWIRP